MAVPRHTPAEDGAYAVDIQRYLAYGSNINLEQMACRYTTAKVIGATMLPNQELNFRRVATIDPKHGSEVPVLVWKIGQQYEIDLDYY